jgi:hypothetical protein
VKHSHIHAVILGSSFVLSLGIVLARVSFAGKPEARERPSAVREERAVSREDEEAEPQGSPDPFVEAQRLSEMADELYRGSAGKDGREGELLQAQEMLKKAQILLDPLIETDPRARDLNLRLGQLIQDVNRAAGF